MNKKFIRFPSIGGFKDTIKHVKSHARYRGKDENGEPILDLEVALPIVKYIGTVKLHGTNASVVFNKDGFYCQSRNRILTPEDDNFGFAHFIHNVVFADIDLYKKKYENLLVKNTDPVDKIIAYGEWCGPGIQKNVGISKIERPMFIIFGFKLFRDNQEVVWDFYHWRAVRMLLGSTPRIHHIEHFKTYTVDIDFNKPELIQNKLIEITEEVEKECPVAKQLGIDNGIGEGIVWMPNNMQHEEFYRDSGYWFKVKGQKHAGASKVKVLVPIDVEKVTSINAFIDSAITEVRLNQGIDYLKEMKKPIEKQSIGDFIKWVFQDILKECSDVMEASCIEPKNISSLVAIKSRNWFLSKINEVTE